MPERYGPWPMLYQQLRRWSAGRSAVCMGSTIVRAHQHAPGTHKGEQPGTKPASPAAGQALGGPAAD
ncbi:hypothetical protein ACLQ2P_32180 [Actinomadura citrea]|uniref:hypothetical protein n=1 Tax=Actinomadura citrea TaxID=46158 RepID=UPI003CE5A413